MQLTCPSCRGTIPADDVHLPSGRAKCRACDAVFRLAGGEDAALAPPPPRLRIPRPRGIEEMPAGQGVAYERRWFSFMFIFMIFFCAVWNGFLLFWYLTAWGAGMAVMLLFPLLHVAVGLGITYYTICGFVNRTRVTLDRDRLTVRHGPLPWPGNRDVPISRIRQLYTEQQVHSSRNGTHLTYRLSAVMDDGSSLKLLSGIDSAEVPRYLEQELESRMGIVNVPVAGELAF